MTMKTQPNQSAPMTGARIARNIGFGLPAGRFFKIEMMSNNGPSVWTKIGGCFYESEAREFAVDKFSENLAALGGLRDCRIREVGQFQATFQDDPIQTRLTLPPKSADQFSASRIRKS